MLVPFGIPHIQVPQTTSHELSPAYQVLLGRRGALRPSESDETFNITHSGRTRMDSMLSSSQPTRSCQPQPPADLKGTKTKRFDFATRFIMLLWSCHLAAIRSNIYESKECNPYQTVGIMIPDMISSETQHL